MIIGAICIIAGGLVSAVTASVPSQAAAWTVAYLVLVSGVAQLALGLGQSALAAVPSWRLIGLELATFNLGNLAVMVGTLVRMPLVVDVGGVLLLVALALFIWGVRGSSSRARVVLYGYRFVTLVLLVSIPIGLALAHIRAA